MTQDQFNLLMAYIDAVIAYHKPEEENPWDGILLVRNLVKARKDLENALVISAP